MPRLRAGNGLELSRLTFWPSLLVAAVLYTCLWRTLLPATLIDGSPWAEIGALFVPAAYGLPALSALQTLDSGYLALLPHLVSLLVASVGTPMALAPLAIQYVAVAIQVFCFFIFAHPTFRPVVRSDWTRWLLCCGLAMHPDADLHTIINTAYLLWIPVLFLVWRDLLDQERPTLTRSWPAALLASMLLLSKGQMIALGPFVAWTAACYARRGGWRLGALWVVPMLAGLFQAYIMYRSLSSVPSFLWQPGDPSTHWLRVPRTIVVMIFRMVQALVGGCFGGRGWVRTVGLATAGLALMMALQLLGRFRCQRRDAFTVQAWAALALVVPPTTAAMAKGPAMVKWYVENYCDAIVSRNSVVGTATLALVIAVLWARSLTTATGLMAKFGLVIFWTWMTLTSAPFFGAAWVFPAEKNILPAQSRLHGYLLDKEARKNPPLVGFCRWQTLLSSSAHESKERQFQHFLRACLMIDPYPVTVMRDCRLLDGTPPWPSTGHVAELSTPQRWMLPAGAKGAQSFAVLVEEGPPQALRAQVLNSAGAAIARLHPLPPVSDHRLQVTYFLPMTSFSEATMIEFSAENGETLKIRLSDDRSRPVWWWFGR